MRLNEVTMTYGQTPLYGHHDIKNSLLCPWGKKALTFSLISGKTTEGSSTVIGSNFFLPPVNA